MGTFFNPSLNGSESSSALAVGGVGGTDEHTPNVDITTTKKAGEDITQSYLKIKYIVHEWYLNVDIHLKCKILSFLYCFVFKQIFRSDEKIYDIIKKTFLTALGSSSELHPFTIAGAIRLAAKIPRGLATNQR